MKRNLSLRAVLLLTATLGFTQATAPTPAAKPSPSASSGAGSSADDLQAVLAQMNQKAGSFKTAQGDFEFDQYQRVVKETDVQKGRFYFRRHRHGVDAAFNITSPDAKQVVFKDGIIRIYEPRIEQVTERDAGKYKSDVEAFLSLGFGARGDDLLKSYDVKMAGWETVDEVKTAKLELVPKSEKVRNTYNKIVLWIDPEKDIILKQQFFESSGDYRLTHYANLKLNGKLSDDRFRLKTTGKTKTVRPQ